MRKEMGLESYMLLVPDSQGQGYFCIFVFVYAIMWNTLSSILLSGLNKEKFVFPHSINAGDRWLMILV